MKRATAPHLRRVSLIIAALVVPIAAGCGTGGDVDAADTTVAVTADATEAPTDSDNDNDNDNDGSTDTGDSGPADDDGSDEVPEACDLLTEEDAAAAFGEPVTAGETNSAYECWWSTDNDLKTVNLEISEPDLDEWRSGLDNDSWQPVDLGDEGYLGVGMFDTVEFRVGDRVIELNVTYSTRGDSDAALEELAERVVART